MLRRTLVMVALLAGGVAALGLGLRALAQSSPSAPPAPPAAPAPSATPAPTPAAAPAATAAPAPAVPAAGDDSDGELKQSADNNLSFPVDI